MEWRSAGGVSWLEAELPGARAAFSTRSAGDAREGHAPLALALGLDPGGIATARQVHGAELATHAGGGEASAAPGVDAKGPEADGHVVADPGLAALVFVADCLPVALAGPRGGAILHCGWRGLAAGIVARGAAAVEATDAAIGPGIGPCCFEVGPEVLDAFAPLGEGVAAGPALDLAEATRRLLEQAGVERVEAAGLCTHCEPDLFFSYRREGERAGRQAGLVRMAAEEG